MSKYYDVLLYLYKDGNVSSCVVVKCGEEIDDVIDYIENNPQIWGDADSWEIVTITKISPITVGIISPIGDSVSGRKLG